MFSRSSYIPPILILAGLWAAFAACDDAAAQLDRRIELTSGVPAHGRGRADHVFREDAYCVEGWCTPNVIEFGYYPTQWRRWPSMKQEPGDGVKRLPDDIRPVDEPDPLDEMSTSVTHPKRSAGAADALNKDAGRSKPAAKPLEGSKPESSDLLETLDESASVDPPPGLPHPLEGDLKKTTTEAGKKAASKVALAAATAKEEPTGKDKTTASAKKPPRPPAPAVQEATTKVKKPARPQTPVKTAAEQDASHRQSLNGLAIQALSDKKPVDNPPATDAGSIRRTSATVTLEKSNPEKAPLVWNGNPLRRSSATSDAPTEMSSGHSSQLGRNPLRSN